jgi:vacuolar-type H+-ATPase subunit H
MLLADAIATKKQLIEEGKQLGEQKKDEIIAAATYEAQMIKAQADSNRQEQTQQLYDQFESMVKKTANA